MKRSWLSRIAVLSLLVASVAINILQGTRILKLERVLDSRAHGGGLSVGSSVPPLELTTVSGEHARIEYNSAATPTLLYVFSPSCIWCRRNATAFKTLTSTMRSKLRVIGISLSQDGMAAFRTESGIDFPVYVPSPKTSSAYNLGETPTTILVSRTGVVLRLWNGAYTGVAKSSVEDYFHLKLPAL